MEHCCRQLTGFYCRYDTWQLQTDHCEAALKSSLRECCIFMSPERLCENYFVIKSVCQNQSSDGEEP